MIFFCAIHVAVLQRGLADLVDLDDGDSADVKIDGPVDGDDDRLPKVRLAPRQKPQRRRR